MAEVRSHDVSLPRPRVASSEPTLEVPRLNDVGNHFTNHTATRNREHNKTPNKYPITRKSSDLLGLHHRKIGELSTLPPHGPVMGPPGTTSFSIPPYRDESATQRRMHGPPLRRDTNPTNTTSITALQQGLSTAHLHRVDEMHHNASPEPNARGGVDVLTPSQIQRPVTRRPSSLSDWRGTIQSPPGGASRVVPAQEFLGSTRSRSPVAVYSDPVPVNESEPTLSYDVHSTSLSPNPSPRRDDAVTQTPDMGVDEGTRTTNLPQPSLHRSPSNPDNLPCQQDADEYLCSSSDEPTTEEEEEDGAYYPHTTQDLQEELRTLRAEMAAEGEVLEGLKAEELTAKNACEGPPHQQPSTSQGPEDVLAGLRDSINDSNAEEAQLRATLLERNVSARNAQARRQHYVAERGRLGDRIYGEVSSIDADMAHEQQVDGGLEAYRAVGTLIHRKNIASEELEQASHDLASISGEMPAMNAASRDARTRYVQEISAATKRAAAEKADLDAEVAESERLRRDEIAQLQLRARELVRVLAMDAQKGVQLANAASSVNSSRDDSVQQHNQRSPPAKPGYTTTVRPTISKKRVEGGRPNKNVVSSVNTSRTTSLAAKSAGSTTSTIPLDKRKPFVVPNKKPPSQLPQQRDPSPSLPPRSNTPQTISRNGRSEVGFGVRSGRRPISPQVAPPQNQRWGVRGALNDEPPVAFTRLMTPPSVSSRVSIPHQRHLHMEAPPHPSNMVVAQRPTSFYY